METKMKILEIGSVDVSDICQVGLTIDASPVNDPNGSFVNVLGQQITARLGTSIKISANFDGVDETTAVSIMQFANSESVDVTYCFPNEKTDTFTDIHIVGVMDFEDSEGVQHWNVSIDMFCPISGEGL